MRPVRKLALLATVVATPVAIIPAMVATITMFASARVAQPAVSRVPPPELIELRAGAFDYRASGDFTRNGQPARAPLVATTIPRTLAVMRNQVTAAEYGRCVEAGACPPAGGDAPDRPIVKVNWWDAVSYAAWLSRETGKHFRLPTDEEWAYAAAERFTDDAWPVEADDPGNRALAQYERQTSLAAGLTGEPQPVGAFGANHNGLVDLAGNVWEWTDTCFARRALDRDGAAMATTIDCGIRIVEGRHRAYVTDFIRDARSGGCSAGVPPSNLGFRLVRDDDPSYRLANR